MASAYTVSDIGQDSGAGDRRALFLEVFSGLVMNAFDTMQTTKDKQIVRRITSGKSA